MTIIIITLAERPPMYREYVFASEDALKSYLRSKGVSEPERVYCIGNRWFVPEKRSN
jgi:hypothetical protein